VVIEESQLNSSDGSFTSVREKPKVLTADQFSELSQKLSMTEALERTRRKQMSGGIDIGLENIMVRSL